MGQGEPPDPDAGLTRARGELGSRDGLFMGSCAGWKWLLHSRPASPRARWLSPKSNCGLKGEGTLELTSPEGRPLTLLLERGPLGFSWTRRWDS